MLLSSINWNYESDYAYDGLLTISDHLLKLPLNHQRESNFLFIFSVVNAVWDFSGNALFSLLLQKKKENLKKEMLKKLLSLFQHKKFFFTVQLEAVLASFYNSKHPMSEEVVVKHRLTIGWWVQYSQHVISLLVTSVFLKCYVEFNFHFHVVTYYLCFVL